MKYIYYLFAYTILLFIIKLFVAYTTFKIDKRKKDTFKELFVWKEELFDCAVVSLIITLFMVFFQHVKLKVVMVVILLTLINSYYFLIVPLRALFQKTKYLKNEVIESFLHNTDYSYRVRVIKGKIENAYATGIFPFTKTILIGEPLCEKMTDDELKAIIYHEIGHQKLGHLYKMFSLNVLSSILFVCLNAYGSDITNRYHYTDTIIEPVIVALVGLTYGLVAFILFPYIFQRRFEYQADSFAVRKVGATQYVQALEKFNEITDNKMVKGSVTHPSLKKRIANAYNTN